MARYPIRDCACEDFPLCEHADNYPSEPEYCDICGYNHRQGACEEFDEEDWEIEESEEEPPPEEETG